MIANSTFRHLLAVLALILSQAAAAQKKVIPSVIDSLIPFDSVAVEGYVGDKLNASYEHRILAQDVQRLVDAFRSRTETRCWQSEFWGKWFTSAVLAFRYRPSSRLKDSLDHAVTELIATQSADGYIGNYADSERLEQWDIWGRKYCILGLLAWYDLTGNKQSLLAASKLADGLMHELKEKNVLLVKKGNHRGMAASSILEPVVLLYRRTGRQQYLDFAEDIVRQWESPDGPRLISRSVVDVAERFPKPKSWFGWEQGQKAYEMMSCYEGLLELYRVTGNPSYKAAVEATWENIREKEIGIAGSGSSVECWFHGAGLQTMPISRYQETCVTATWIKLSQQLLRLTGDVKYADAIEQSFYNALLGAMKDDGSDWVKYSPIQGMRQFGEDQCSMGINCCEASGPRGLFTIPFSVLMQARDGFQVNFFMPGSYRAATPAGQRITISQSTDYPATGHTTLQLTIPRGETFTMKIRIPEWSAHTQLTVNGEPVQQVVPGTLAVIRRKWSSGDVIDLTTDMRGRIVTLGTRPVYKAIMTGPIVLARDVRLGGSPVDDAIAPLTGADGYFPLQPVHAKDKEMWLVYQGTFTVESDKAPQDNKVQLLLCDYASAGKTFDEHSWFRVWLEQCFSPR